MGSVVLRGRARPVELMEPVPEFDDQDRKALSDALVEFPERRHEAIVKIEQIFARNRSDKSLENLLYRLRNQGEEDACILA